MSDVDGVDCPSCEQSFNSSRGMKSHHAQTHHRSLNHDFRNELHLACDEFDGRRLLLTLYDDETATTQALDGTLHDTKTKTVLDDGVRKWPIRLQRDPIEGYYIHMPDTSHVDSDEKSAVGRIVRIQHVVNVRVVAGDDEGELETVYEGLMDLSDRVPEEYDPTMWRR